MGLWAIDSHNPNSFAACGDNTMKKSKADVLATQETRLNTDDDISSAKGKSKHKGWSAHFSTARTTAAGRGSGGCGVAVKKGAGITPIDTSKLDTTLPHRISAA